MTVLVTYDIKKNKLRTKIADSLLEIGFTRVQKSVYLARIKKKTLDKWLKKYEPKLETDDKLYIINLSESRLRQMYAWGFDQNMDMILSRTKTLVI